MVLILMFLGLATAAQPVEQPLTCMEMLDDGPEPKAQLLLMWSRIRRSRIEGLDLYSDGSVLMRTQLTLDRGLKSCRAKVTKERVESFEAEFRRGAVCAVRSAKFSGNDERDSIDLDPGTKKPCHIQLSPSAWARKPATRALQQAIDRLRNDICEGPCTDPKRPSGPFELVEDASRVSPAARHLYQKPDAAPPDAAPAPQPPRKP